MLDFGFKVLREIPNLVILGYGGDKNPVFMRVFGFGKGPKNLVMFLHFDEKTPKCSVKILPKSSENAEFVGTIIYELSVMRREDFLEKDAHGWYNG